MLSNSSWFLIHVAMAVSMIGGSVLITKMAGAIGRLFHRMAH